MTELSYPAPGRAAGRASAVRPDRSVAIRPRPIATARRLTAELIGTFWLVLGGCGAAVLAAGANVPGSIDLVGVSLAFGLTVFTLAFAVGFISGGHFNPDRSTRPALFVEGWALSQRWLFWLAPPTRAAVAGLLGRWLFAHTDEDQSPCPISDTPVELMVGDDRPVGEEYRV